MAEKRCFTKKITESDSFLEMPLSAQCLYFHLNLNADDDGFVNSPKRICKMLGASEDDAKLLVAKSFIIPFPSGVIVVKHWLMHNSLRKDRSKPTPYQDELSCLGIKDNGSYTLNDEILIECQPNVNQLTTKCQPTDNQLTSQDKISKDKLSKDKIDIPKPKGFVAPTVEEVEEYIKEKGYKYVSAFRFVSYYESIGWVIGRQKTKMKSWQSALAGWEAREKENRPTETKDKFDSMMEKYMR